MFGMPPYGGSIAQNVYYADDDLCSSFVNVTKGYPQRPDPEDPWPSPFILLVDRGGCAFTTKVCSKKVLKASSKAPSDQRLFRLSPWFLGCTQVRNAQRVGAAGVLIGDNTCLCSASNCVSDLPCEANEPIMADDGSGSDISIPSMLIFKPDADLFKKELMANHPIQVEMIWSLPTPDDRVEYDLWTTPSDLISKDFFQTFKKISIALDHRSYFTPHQYIYDGARSGCIGQAKDDNACESLCTNNGRYCATDPDGDLDSGVSGAQVVEESLRRLCIWEHYGRKDGIGVRWWMYVEEFSFKCDTPELFADKKCIQEVYDASGIDFAVVYVMFRETVMYCPKVMPSQPFLIFLLSSQRCIHDSGGLDTDSPNNKLDMEISNEVTRGVVVIPSAYVNDVPVRGAFTATNIFTAICAGFAEGTAPVVCSQCTRCPNPIDCVETGFCTNTWEHHFIKKHIADKDGESISSSTFFLTVLLCMGGVAVMGVWYHNRSNVQMREQMRTLLAQYMPLDDDEEGMNNPMEFTHHNASASPLLMTTNSNNGDYNQTGEGASSHVI